MKVLYENWAKIDCATAAIIIAILYFLPILGLEIGSYEWLFWLVIPFYFIQAIEIDLKLVVHSTKNILTYLIIRDFA